MTTSRRLSPPRQSPVIKSANSTGNIRKMAAVASPTMLHSPTHFRLGSESLSTLRDPRSENDLRGAAASAREASLHPDLNLEVAALSNKLISAINHQTHLDDALATARDELRQTHARLKESEAHNADLERQMQDGSWVSREEVDERTSELFRKFSVEKRAREMADREKRAIESELADLSTKLFEEANQLVVKARKETEAAEIKTEQVRGQLAETESLLESQQEQLVQLKMILEQAADQEERDATNHSTAPSTPALNAGAFDSTRGLDTPQFGNVDGPDPAPALHFSHLVTPVLRNDVPAFDDFKGLLEINRKLASAPASRAASGTYSVVNASGVASHSAFPSNSSSTNLAAVGSQPHSPSQSTNSTASNSSLYSPTFLPPLRDTKFFKRALAEDIDPTLRLDSAPGLSFFARRAVTAAINDNTLILEPLPSSTRKLITSCTLCGERRRGDEYARTHRFKAGEESAQWYPLCAYCVARLRSTCDYIGFLRMVRDGFWRCEGEKGEEKAWEESVRLRERMFWARVGGGVVPSFTATSKDEVLGSRLGSKRPSIDVSKRRISKDANADIIDESAKSEPYTPPQSAKDMDNNSADLQSQPSEEEMFEIRELPSTAPPLQASSTTVSPTNAVHPRNFSGASEPAASTTVVETSITEPLRQSFASSFKRLSFRDGLRFGSRSRNPSTDRVGGVASPTVESPRLGAVAEMKAVYEGKDESSSSSLVKDEALIEDKVRNIDSETVGETESTVANAETESHSKSEAALSNEGVGHEEQEQPESAGLNISLPGGFA